MAVNPQHGTGEVQGVEHRAQRQDDQGGNHLDIGPEGRKGEQVFGDEAHGQRQADHAEGSRREGGAGQMVGPGRALQVGKALLPSGHVAQPGGRQEQRRLRHGVGQDMEQRRQNARFGRDADAQVDIADLGGGGIGDHAEDIVFPHGADRAHHNTHGAEGEQDVVHAALIEYVCAEYVENDLDEEENVTLGDEAGKDARRAGRRIAVGIRHPEMEGKQAALDGDAHGHEADRRRDGRDEQVAGPEGGDRQAQVRHQELSGDVVQQHQAQQEHAGAHQGEDHVADGGQGGPAPLPDHQQPAGGQGADLNKHIAGENVVGVDQHQQGRLHQIRHDVIEVALVRLQVLPEMLPAAQQAQEQHRRKGHGEQGLQDADAQLVAPGVGIVAHQVVHVLPQREDIRKQDGGAHAHQAGEDQTQPPRRPARQGAGDHRAQQRRHDGEQGEIHGKTHVLSSCSRRACM